MSNFQPNVLNAINAAAQRYGVDPQALIRIAQIESGGNPNAQNPNSSAGGLFQFIDGTAKQYNLGNRFDADQASDAAARLARDNGNYLSRILGRAPSAGELYLAHQQGSGGASKLLSNPNARAIDIVGEKAVRLNGGTSDMTAQQFANKWINKGSIGSQVASQQASPPQASGTPAPEMGEPINIGSQSQGGIMGAFAPSQPQQQQPSFMGGIDQIKNGNYLEGAGQMFGSLSAGGGQQQAPQAPPMQLAPVQGPSSQQATALANYVQSLLGKKVANG